MINVEIKFRQKRRGNLLDISLVANKKYRTIVKINPYSCFTKFIMTPTVQSLDILYFTSIIYSIDKLIPRSEANDNWSRDIQVAIPISNPEIWNHARLELKQALDFLTGDNWNISFYQLKRLLFQAKKKFLPLNANIEHVCLFSGGLDSLAGAIDLIDGHDNVLLVSHTDATGAALPIQEPLIEEIRECYHNKNISHSTLHVYADASNEGTTRGRSILFHGLALFHAMNFGLDKIIAPENGVISINLPLTPSRTGSNSTKTMHPYFLMMFQNALSKLNINIAIVNPYVLKTKGEMLVENKNRSLIHSLATKTLSCSHGGGHTPGWHRQSYNCGYCIPCTIRRASIHKFDSTLDNGMDYGHDLNSEEIDLVYNEKRLDLLALAYFLNRKLNHKELQREIRLMVKVDNIEEIASMLKRGYKEIKEYIDAKADEEVKRLFR